MHLYLKDFTVLKLKQLVLSKGVQQIPRKAPCAPRLQVVLPSQ